MASQAREKFATQVNSEILAAIRNLAQSEGRQLQALVDEALADLLDKRKQIKPRANGRAVDCRDDRNFQRGEGKGQALDAALVIAASARREAGVQTARIRLHRL